MKKIEIFGFVLMIFALISAVCVIADEYDYDFTYQEVISQTTKYILALWNYISLKSYIQLAEAL